jgi:hypothetical protein
LNSSEPIVLALLEENSLSLSEVFLLLATIVLLFFGFILFCKRTL